MDMLAIALLYYNSGLHTSLTVDLQNTCTFYISITWPRSVPVLARQRDDLKFSSLVLNFYIDLNPH